MIDDDGVCLLLACVYSKSNSCPLRPLSPEILSSCNHFRQRRPRQTGTATSSYYFACTVSIQVPNAYPHPRLSSLLQSSLDNSKQSSASVSEWSAAADVQERQLLPCWSYSPRVSLSSQSLVSSCSWSCGIGISGKCDDPLAQQHDECLKWQDGAGSTRSCNPRPNHGHCKQVSRRTRWRVFPYYSRQ